LLIEVPHLQSAFNIQHSTFSIFQTPTVNVAVIPPVTLPLIVASSDRATRVTDKRHRKSSASYKCDVSEANV
jgi:hypothetical protein